MVGQPDMISKEADFRSKWPMAHQRNAAVSLRSEPLNVQIDPLGAQLSVLQDRSGGDLLWNGDPAVWAGRAPILFPIVGTLARGRFRVGAQEYRLPRHGFARGRSFAVLEASSSRALFRLDCDAQTLQVYPFRFQLDVEFSLTGATLEVVSSVRNLGHEPMPASIGYHPGLRWPLPYGRPRAAHFIEFANDEAPSIRRLGTDGLLTAVRHPTPVSNRRLALDDALFRDDVVIFDDIRSRSVTYGADQGPRIRVDYPDAEYLGIWTKPGAEFICIEPWRGIADEAGTNGELATKLGVFSVAPGSVETLTMRISLVE